MRILRCQTIVSLSHRIVTSMLISRCQTILSLSLTELSPRCLFPGVKPSSLSHTHTHTHRDIIVTPTLISSCQTIVSLSQRSSPRCLFPGAEPSSLSLSLSEIVTSISFLHTETNKAQATRTLRRSSALKLVGAHLRYTVNS
jgi:hypothetical protein